MKWLLLLALSPVACAPASGLREVGRMVSDRTGYAVPRSPLAKKDRARVQSLLSRPLGVEEAVEIALLRNAELQAALSSLGIARADLIGAGLLANPELQSEVGFAEGHAPTDYKFQATESLSGLILLPLERRAATAAFEAEKLEAAATALDLIFETKRTFYDYQAAEQTVELMRTVVDASSLAYEFARRLRDAGNLTDLELTQEQAFFEEARLQLADADLRALNLHEKLNALLGLSGNRTNWRATARLPEPPEQEIELKLLEKRAVEQSLDLRALEKRYALFAWRANLARAGGLIPDVRAGVRAEREEGVWEIGPAVSLSLPLFDQGQAGVERARAQMRRVRASVRATAVRLRAAVRAATNRLITARRRVAHYRRILLPLREQIVGESQKQYYAMELGVFQLIDAKRTQVDTGRRYVEALRDYWLARAALDQMLAGRMVEEKTPVRRIGRGLEEGGGQR